MGGGGGAAAGASGGAMGYGGGDYAAMVDRARQSAATPQVSYSTPNYIPGGYSNQGFSNYLQGLGLSYGS
jgi:hypothetical protein